ncbi:hypothetical protein LB526_26710 [Mesorhizobium sp. CA6]|uniref:O-methyltransferase n=1 Tax=Mesorhizobium sp. CA6 TaxID=588500 RepID=UPI001CCD5DF6|nr:O-methyltransferase [Mesorhizobium sp. CA6]MBZ9770349.1 hypothetical protein [Mesorhizobium sp. CA6]
MTDSFRKIDYRLRPAKHAERAMLVELVKRLRFCPTETYQYIGMGSVAFIDHRMMHRHAGIADMISFEGTDDETIQERFRRNVPLSCVKMEFGMSTTVLPKLDFTKRSVVWLDYDDTLQRTMVSDIETVGRTVADGSFVAVTFAISFPTEADKRPIEMSRLLGEFPEYVTEDTKPGEMESGGLARLGRQAFSDLLAKAISDADAGIEQDMKRRAEQVCYFRYRDGAPMCTLGWVITSNRTAAAFQQSNLAALPFYKSGSEPFNIRIPKITPYEVREMERRLPDIQHPELTWIPSGERTAFASIYRFLPTFGVFEPV